MTADCNADEMVIRYTEDIQNVSIGKLDTEVPVHEAESEPIKDHIATASENTNSKKCTTC